MGHAGTRVEIDEKDAWTAPGWAALVSLLALLAGIPALVLGTDVCVGSLVVAGVGLVAVLVPLSSLVVVAPGQTRVMQFFGGYVGTAILLRLDPRVHAAPPRWAAGDLRSVNAQFGWLLRRALLDARRMPRDVAAPRPTANRTRDGPRAGHGTAHGVPVGRSAHRVPLWTISGPVGCGDCLGLSSPSDCSGG